MGKWSGKVKLESEKKTIVKYDTETKQKRQILVS